MKIAFISHMYPSAAHPTYGLFIHEHVRALQRRGVKTMVLAPTPWTPPGLGRLKGKWADYAKSAGVSECFEGVPVARPAYVALPGPMDFARAWAMAASLCCGWRRWMSDFDCDVIHAHALTPDGFAACKLGGTIGRPVVCSARGSEVHQTPQESPAVRRMTHWLLRKCDAAVAVSHALARDVAVLAGGRVQPKVVYNGVTEDFHPAANRQQVRQQLGLPDAARIILFVGRCEMDKGAGDLLRAFRSIAAEEPSAALLFVGEGGARQELERQAGSRVWFAGHVGRGRIALYLQAADIFVLPSHGEGMPNALLEAMAVGLPCVAARVGGIPEAIEDGVNGLLIPMQSPADIAAAVKRVFKSPDLAARLGSAAMRTVKERFTWNGNAQEHMAIYEETIRKYQAHAN